MSILDEKQRNVAITKLIKLKLKWKLMNAKQKCKVKTNKLKI